MNKLVLKYRLPLVCFTLLAILVLCISLSFLNKQKSRIEQQNRVYIVRDDSSAAGHIYLEKSLP
jgi:hypothetical protein